MTRHSAYRPRSATRIRAVFLDAGNTLFAERTSRADVYAEVAARHGITTTRAQVVTALKATHESMPVRISSGFRYSRPWFERYIAEVFRRLGHARLAPGVPAELFARFARADTFKVFPDVGPALEQLASCGVALGVVSNWSPSLATLLEELGLARHFGFVLASALEEAEKPSSAIFRRALQFAGVSPGEALHVGDRLDNDVGGARAAGLTGVLLDREGTAAAEEDLLRIGSLAELPALLATAPFPGTARKAHVT